MTTDSDRFTRRTALQAGGVLALGAVGCSASTSDGSPTDTGVADSGTTAADTGGDLDAAAASPDAMVDTGTNEVAWLTGGTPMLAASYPSPFTALGAQCALTCEQALGPCYVTAEERKDISEGYSGLPMRLLVRVVRADGCTPVTDATVDIWHTDIAGVYSGPTPSTICNPSARDVSQERFFRGLQPTDGEGVAAFDTVLPGWYPSRTAHVHFTIRTGTTEWATSQLYFEDALTAEIYASHPEYMSRGSAPVTNRNDGLIADGPIAEWAKQSDGALLCWTTVVLRNAITDPAC